MLILIIAGWCRLESPRNKPIRGQKLVNDTSHDKPQVLDKYGWSHVPHEQSVRLYVLNLV